MAGVLTTSMSPNRRFMTIIIFVFLFFTFTLHHAISHEGSLPGSQGSRSSFSSSPKKHLSRPKMAKFPRKIWQTWKRPLDQLLPQLREYSKTWDKLNPSYRRELLTDDAMYTYIQDSFPDRPEIMEAYESFENNIFKVDFMRYLIMLHDGGLYTDIDTKAFRPIDTWIPDAYKEEDIGLVLGVEIDSTRMSEPFLQWSQYTMMAKPNHPILHAMVDRIIATALDAKRNNVTLSADDDAILTTTGPKAWGPVILETLSAMTGEQRSPLEYRDLGKTPTQSTLVADVLMLHINAFGCGQEHSGSTKPDNTSLVQHIFRASWRANPGANADKELQEQD